MPTYAWLATFRRDFERLTPAQQALFLTAVQQFMEDLQETRTFRKGLRVKVIQGATGIFEMTWAADGRATFEYGDEVTEGEPHVVWRRVESYRRQPQSDDDDAFAMSNAIAMTEAEPW